MSSIRRLVLLNQMAGPLFRQLAEDLACHYPDGCLMLTGHPDTLGMVNRLGAGLEIRNAPAYDRGSRLRRVFSWMHYLLASTGFVLLARKGDAILLVSNPPVLGVWVWLLTRIRQVPYVVLVYDIYPDVLERLGAIKSNGWQSRLWRALNRRVYGNSRAIVTLGNRMARTLERQMDNEAPPVSVIPPWVDIGFIRPLGRNQNSQADRYVPKNKIVILYSGNMGASHDIESILEAANLLRDDCRIFFLMIGEGVKLPHAIAFVHRHRLTNVHVFPFQPEEQLPFTLSLGDISLVALDDGMEDLMVPSKVYSYLAAGSAVIAIANHPSELLETLSESDCGLSVRPRHPSDLVEAILELVSDPGRLSRLQTNARVLAVERYSRDVGVKDFACVLENSGLLPAQLKM